MRRVLLGVFLSAIAALSCGGEEEAALDEPLTTEDYAKRVAELQEEAAAAFNEDRQDFGSTQNPREYFLLIAQDHEVAIREGDRFFNAVGSLLPPSALQNAHDAFIAAWRSYRAALEEEGQICKAAETSDDLDELTPESDAAARNPFEDACISLEDAVTAHGYAANFSCDVDWFFGGASTRKDECPEVPVEGRPTSRGSDCPIVPSSLRGYTRIGVMPPIPSGLVAVSYYWETVRQPVGADFSTIGLPLLEPVSDPASIALYTYSDGTWERIADVTIRDVGTLVVEATFESTFPANYAVLQKKP